MNAGQNHSHDSHTPPVKRGIYFLANDRRLDNAIALLNSVRALDTRTPIAMIPYDANHQNVARIARDVFDASVFDDTAVIDWIDARFERHFGSNTRPRNPGTLRKCACWFGPFDEFLYLDCNLIVLERIAALLEYLEVVDFVSCDDRFERGLADVFSDAALDGDLLPANALNGIFDTGLFASHTALFDRDRFDDAFAEAADRRRYFDFSRGEADRPILNFAVLRSGRKRLNVYRDLPGEPSMCATSPHLVSRGTGIVDRRNGRIPRYVRWSGTPIGPGGAHWDVWRYYRDLRPELPPAQLPPVSASGWWARLRDGVRSLRPQAGH